MRIRYSTNVNKFPEMEAAANVINGKKIKVGVKGEQAWLASIHEYGCTIQITPKMRAWLHRNGLHVKDSTTQIVIPERAFLRTGFDENHNEVISKVENVLPLLLAGSIDENTFYNLIGTLLRDKIKDYAVELNSPPNHQFTIARKGSSNPLVDTGDMINSIEFEVE